MSALPKGAHEPIRVLWARDQIPVTVLLDDAAPCRNPMWYERPTEGHVAEIPNGFAEEFADVAERTGAAGKFSVIPMPGAQGRIDSGVPGVPQSDIAQFISLVKDRIAPRWDISPELITHNQAVDIASMQPLPEREDAWAAQQDEETLVEYISVALQILINVDLEPNGVTSPWALGAEVEDAYVRAISRALHDRCGVDVGWYFLHANPTAPAVPPEVTLLQPEAHRAMISLVGCNREDIFWRTQRGERADLDSLLSADGSSGRFADLFSVGSPILFYTHWQSLFSNGTGDGLRGMEELCARINRSWGTEARWTPARELAEYCAARESVRFSLDQDENQLLLETAFECPDFTFSIPVSADVHSVCMDGVVLNRIDADEPLFGGLWQQDSGSATVCAPLRNGARLAWQ